MSIGIRNKWVLIPATILTFLAFADVAHVIGYINRHRFGRHVVTPIAESPICDCHKLCDGIEKCHLGECPHGR